MTDAELRAKVAEVDARVDALRREMGVRPLSRHPHPRIATALFDAAADEAERQSRRVGELLDERAKAIASIKIHMLALEALETRLVAAEKRALDAEARAEAAERKLAEVKP